MSEERRERVRNWLEDPLTQEFMAIVQAECRTARESTVREAEQGLESARASAAMTSAYRWVLTGAVTVLLDQKEAKEAMRYGNGSEEEESPEELRPGWQANALPQGDGEQGVDADSHP